ncbi:hypothetical protein HD599_001201 [Conyzicola lurida]|uniref:Potassium channel domain-containing protein n=1 Tax=Conyzicola lurida TaxID=1172621 RepID=A0A841AKK9_9MICO|nr:ion channel [Conyzicola lurida]MBB5842878.1 hypothetical protein [Conyzicola lurida]
MTRRRPLWRSEYWFVLVLIAVSYTLCALQTGPNPSGVAFLVQLATVAVILWVAEVRPRLRRIGWIVLAVAGIATAGTSLLGASGFYLDVVLAAASALAYLVAPMAIIAHIVRRDRVDGQALLAAIAAYILVGMFFTFVYNVIALVSSVATFGPDQPDSLTTQLFFSFTTLTTTGYGNIVPVSAGVQSVAIAEAITGQLFLVIAVARVVSGWTRRTNGAAG